jgi:hypothetical protein
LTHFSQVAKKIQKMKNLKRKKLFKFNQWPKQLHHQLKQRLLKKKIKSLKNQQLKKRRRKEKRSNTQKEAVCKEKILAG